MQKNAKKSSLGTDFWVRNPALFMFLICRMLRYEEGSPCKWGDVLFFLKARRIEAEDFVMTHIPPVDWLLRLVDTREGRAVLRFFNLPEEKPVLQQLKCAIEEDAGLFDIPFKNILNQSLLFDGGEDMARNDAKKIPENPRERLVVGLYRITGTRDKISLNVTLRINAGVISKFEQDGILTEELKTAMLRFSGAQDILDRYEKNAKGYVATLVREERFSSKTSRPKRKYTRRKQVALVGARQPDIQPGMSLSVPKATLPNKPIQEVVGPIQAPMEVAEKPGSENEHKGKNGHNVQAVEMLKTGNDVPIRLIPTSEVFHVFKAIKETSNMDDAMISAVLGEDVRDIRKGKIRLSTGHLSMIARTVKIDMGILKPWLEV